MKRGWMRGRLLCLWALLVVMLFTELPVQTFAGKSYPKITAQTKKKRKKAPELELNTIYRVIQKKNKSMVRFKVKKTGTYVFTVASLKSSVGSKALGEFCLYRDSVAGLIPMTVKTKGGKSKLVRIAAANTYRTPAKVSTVSFLKKRSAKLKLKKGFSYLMELDYTSKKGKACTYLIKVEKK